MDIVNKAIYELNSAVREKNMMITKPLLLFGFFLDITWLCNGANILIVSPTSMHSHHIAFLDVWKELHSRGHNITFMTAYPVDITPVNFTQIDSSMTDHLMTTKYDYQKITETSKWFIWNIYWDLTLDSQKIFLSIPEMQDLIHNHKKYKFDAVITELWHTNIFAYSKLFNCPSIAYATIDVYEALHWHLGNQMNHITLPDLNSGLFEATTFYERLTSALYTAHELLKEYLVYIPSQTENLKHFFGEYTNVTVQELKQNIDLLMINANPFLKGVRAVSPTTVMVGGGNHISPLKPLPNDLQVYLDGANKGFIYLSLGTNVRSNDLDEDTIGTLVDVFDKLPYKVLWKFESDVLPTKSKNVKIVKWAPQQDVLRHPNIKLFISQGGIQSLEETIFSHVPVLIMPFFGDQFKNGQLVKSKGFGRVIQHKPTLDRHELESNINELIDNPSYKATAKRLATLMNDSYMSGMEKSIWWIEYVIRNNGTRELRNPAAKLPFYQYYALDVLGFLCIAMLLLVSFTLFFLRTLATILQKSLKKNKKKQN